MNFAGGFDVEISGRKNSTFIEPLEASRHQPNKKPGLSRVAVLEPAEAEKLQAALRFVADDLFVRRSGVTSKLMR